MTERGFHGMDTRAKYIIYCDTYAMAANYATKKRWHMNDWRYYFDDVAPGKVVVYERQKAKDPSSDKL
jgi:hypothetical protein